MNEDIRLRNWGILTVQLSGLKLSPDNGVLVLREHNAGMRDFVNFLPEKTFWI